MHVQINRRSFLAGSGAVLLAACSGTTKSSDTISSLTMVTFSDTSALVPGKPARVTIGFADKDGVTLAKPAQSGPLTFTVESNGQRVGDPITVEAHTEGIPRAYYPVVFTPPAAGVYGLSTGVNNAPVSVNLQIPDSTSVVGAGQKMIPFDTPTFDDHRGVDLLCTRNPQCPLHDVTLTQALAGGTPVAFLISTPQFCQQAICGPVLDVLLAQKDKFPGVKMLHSEVYPTVADAQAGGNGKLDPVVSAYGLTFEPALYLAAKDGTIVERIDTIFDGVELRDALTRLTA